MEPNSVWAALRWLAVPVISGVLAMYGAQIGVEKEIGYLKQEMTRIDREQRETQERQRAALTEAARVHGEQGQRLNALERGK